MKIKSKFAIILPTILVCALAIVLCLVLLPEKSNSFSVVADDVTMACGDIEGISYTCSDTNAVVSFESFNPKIVEIDGNNLVAKKTGETSVRVKAQGEKATIYSSFKVAVVENASLPLTDLPDEITIYLLDKNFEAARADGFDNSYLYVRNREISSVDSCKFVKVSANKITASKAGSGEVIFHSASGESQTVKVNVLTIKAQIVGLPTSISMNPADSYKCNYAITPSYYTGEVDVEFSTASECLSVSENTIIARTSGEGTINVSVGDNSYTVGVVVNSQIKYVLSVNENCRIDGNKIYVKSGEEASFKLNLFTLDDSPVAFSSVEFSTSGVKIEREVNNIDFSSESGGVISIYSSSLLSYVRFYVYVC